MKNKWDRPPTDEEIDAWLYDKEPLPWRVKIWMLAGWLVAIGWLLLALIMWGLVVLGLFWLVDHFIWGTA